MRRAIQAPLKGQLGQSTAERLFIIFAVSAFVIIAILIFQSDKDEPSTVDSLKTQTNARWIQTVDGSNAFIIIADSDTADTYFCTIHYTGVNSQTEVVRKSAVCLDDNGVSVPAPFVKG